LQDDFVDYVVSLVRQVVGQMFAAVFLMGIFSAGFGFGYAVRAWISHKRRQASRSRGLAR
jgi:hypothetical protein